MKEETKRWIEKAEDDIRVAKYMLKMKQYTYAAFWCQQAAEKSFKAVQIEKEGKFDKVHDLVLLGQKVNAPAAVVKKCKKLTLAYTYARYPDASQGKEDMKILSNKFIKDAEEIIKWAKNQL